MKFLHPTSYILHPPVSCPSMNLRDAKIAIVCDWLTSFGGAERVIIALHELFPDATIYTSIYDQKNFPQLANAKVVTSFLQKIPGAKKHHQLFLPFMPIVFENFNLNTYDLVISSNHSCSKGIITKPETVHVSYCHSPMRYAWDGYQKYIQEYRINGLIKKWGKKFLHKIRMWDRLAADRVDHFLTNSAYVKKRIQKYYHRDATIIHPGIEIEKLKSAKEEKKYYLAVGRITTYKKFDLIVDTFNELESRLKIVGTGVEEKNLKKRAHQNIEFLGRVSDQELSKLYAGAKALIFPQCEDFGITPIESMAHGTPVIAYREGGALETIKEGITGIFFEKQEKEDLLTAIQKFEKQEKNFSPEKIHTHAEKFSNEIFKKNILKFLEVL